VQEELLEAEVPPRGATTCVVFFFLHSFVLPLVSRLPCKLAVTKANAITCCLVPHSILFSVFTEPVLNFAMCYNLFGRLLFLQQGFRREEMHVINQDINTSARWGVALQLLFFPLLWVFLKFL